ncbi:MAG: threonine synthase, partial [Clostridiales bacterium]|nr:threonine synthase [Clostridiales bacterium]
VNDITLTLLPYLLCVSKKLLGNDKITLIPVATSGDTGKAALEGFRNVEGTGVAVFYPDGGVSDLQRLQMITTEGNNVFVSAIQGNFDDAQTAVKKAFTDPALKAELDKSGVELSSANSINFGRLAPQITYYFTAYADLLGGGQIAYGDLVDFCVPSGNFGDILAGYYARKMGLPVGRLICASNINNVLCDFIRTGTYDKRRDFKKTTSPSMDILISSNLERLIFDLSGADDAVTADRMRKLNEEGVYRLSEKETQAMQAVFAADYATEEEVAQTIARYFDEYGYIMDPHTAVAACVADKQRGDRPTVILSTASPHKFAASVLSAIGAKPTGDEVKDLQKLENETALEAPETLISLPKKDKLFTGSIAREEISATVLRFGKKLAEK